MFKNGKYNFFIAKIEFMFVLILKCFRGEVGVGVRTEFLV